MSQFLASRCSCRPLRAAIVLACTVGLLACLQGCIVQDIAGNLRTANTQLASANTRIDATRSEIAIANARLSGVLSDLEATNTKLLDTNTKLVDVQGGLTRVDTTNTSLGTLDSQLSQMQASLTRIDGHLASLRQTLSAVDGMIPFLDLGTGSVEPALPVPPVASATETGAASGEASGAGATGSASASAASAPAARPSTAQPASLAGVWLVASTSVDEAWLLRSDGTFAIARAEAQPAGAGQPRAIAFRGRWMIETRAAEASASVASAPATARVPQQLVLLPAEGTNELARYTIEQQSSRSLTLVEGTGLAPGSSMVVLRRP